MTLEAVYELYLRCLPAYRIKKSLFLDLLKPDQAHLIGKYDGDRLIGFSMIHESSISLLCVEREYQNKGYGSQLLAESEDFIRKNGADRILLGRGAHYLLQGVPTEDAKTVAFFEHRGYTAEWTSVNMSLPLDDFDASQLDIPQLPEGIGFRLASSSDKASLLDAVSDAHAPWRSIYETCVDPVLVAVSGDEIVGFEILSPDGGRFHPPAHKVGAIGCVGVVHAYRQKGIGRQMVVNGAKWLQDRDCVSIELRYVELVDWYKKIGFQVARKQWMGEKRLGTK